MIQSQPGAPSENRSLLQQLGLDYKEFKKVHPQRTARIPRDLKQRAKDVLEGGATIHEIASSTGLTVQTIERWFNRLASKAKVERSSRKLSSSPTSQTQADVSDLTTDRRQDDRSREREKWIKIRIDGREIEVATADFWKLMSLRS